MAFVLKAVLERGRKNYSYILVCVPYLFTFANVVFGFLSILESIEENYLKAACYIGLAACMDLLDGRIARAMGLSSFLGGQLDALCDAISFCLAPCVLLAALYDISMHSFGCISLSIYLCSGLFRLARFTATVASQDRFFVGLPTTMAAFFVASLVLYHTWLQQHAAWLISEWTMWSIVMCLAILMSSTIPFPAFKKIHLAWYHAILASLLLAGLMMLCMYLHLPFLLVGFTSYILVSLLWYLMKVCGRSLDYIS